MSTVFDSKYEIVITRDGSPSLKRISPTESESMHNSAGAYSETLAIYGRALDWAFDNASEASVLSVGLGLGYVELLAAEMALARSRDLVIQSYEIDPALVSGFLQFLRRENFPENSLYSDVLRFFKNGEAARDYLFKLYQSGDFIISPALTETTEFKRKYSCIMYDAFSSKTDGYLWEQKFLEDFFARVSAPECAVSTYACTGNLKRALKLNGFDLQLDGGFHKRQSIFATKR